MATYGDSSAGANNVNPEGRYYGNAVTIGVAGETCATATFWLSESSTNNAHAAKAVCVRLSDGVVIAESAERQDFQTGSNVSYEFTFSSGTLSNTDYVFGLHVSSAAGNLNMECDTSTGTLYFQITGTYPTMPDPATLSTGTARFRMSITTNDPGGGTAVPVLRRHYQTMKQ